MTRGLTMLYGRGTRLNFFGVCLCEAQADLAFVVRMHSQSGQFDGMWPQPAK